MVVLICFLGPLEYEKNYNYSYNTSHYAHRTKNKNDMKQHSDSHSIITESASTAQLENIPVSWMIMHIPYFFLT